MVKFLPINVSKRAFVKPLFRCSASFIRLSIVVLVLVQMISTGVVYASSIILQSTTSTQNSGLFDYILPQFTADTGIVVHVVAVGTGQALKNGRNGDGDVLLVHARTAEEQFVSQGYGVYRLDVMYNDFVLLGPENDPAGTRGTKDILTALQRIATNNQIFVSRGDDSGTNKKELALWQEAAIDVTKASGTWYREAGAGMGATLNLAAATNAYTLSDRATWIAFQNKSDLEILGEGDRRLFNQYGVILVNPERHPHVKADAAERFIKWLTGTKGQAAINAFRIDNQQMFFSNAQ